MKVLFAGGGTGGHVFPAISIAQELQSRVPNVNIQFLGTKRGAEATIVPQYGYNIHFIDIQGFSRSSLMQNIGFPYRLLKGTWQSHLVLDLIKPDVFIATGGYVAGPAGRLAHFKGVPVYLHEQNAVPGVTSKQLAKISRKIFLTFEESKKYFLSKNHSVCYVVGNPVRMDFLKQMKSKASIIKELGLDPERKTILVIGGSTGARSINQTIQSGFEAVLNAGYQLIWQAGKTLNELPELPKGLGVLRKEFFDNMPELLWVSDLVVSRAGAGALAEISLLGKPSILVPYPYAAANHQEKNAHLFQEHGAGIIIGDKQLNQELITTLLKIMENPAELLKMAEKSKQLSFPYAAKSIVDEILKDINLS